MVELAACWLLNYLLHSTVWLGGASLVQRMRRDSSPRFRDLLWKSAWCGALLTPSLALAWGPGSGLAIGVPGPSSQTVVPARTTAGHTAVPGMGLADGSALPLAPPPGFAQRSTLSAESLLLAEGARRSVRPEAAVTPRPTSTEQAAFTGWAGPAVGIWLLSAAAALWLLARRREGLRDMLAERRPVEDRACRAVLRELQRAAGGRRAPRLSCSPRLPVPVAFGWLRPEICVPERALRELSPDEFRGLLGHELCHLHRRDPLWLGAFHAVERLLFLQPLNRVARRAAGEAAEELCDAWSARHAGAGAMADCLARVAGWLVPPPGPLPAACMARSTSSLGRRIERLVDAEHDHAAADRAGWSSLSCVTLLLSASLALPSFRPTTPEVAATLPSLRPTTPEFSDALPRVLLSTSPGTDAATAAPELLIREAASALPESIAALELEIQALRREVIDRGSDPEAVATLEQLEARVARLHALTTRLATSLPSLSQPAPSALEPDRR